MPSSIEKTWIKRRAATADNSNCNNKAPESRTRNLHVRVYSPTTNARTNANDANAPIFVRCVLVFFHGLHEHCQRFGRFFSECNENGIAVVTFDMIGHGLSEGISSSSRKNNSNDGGELRHQIESFEKSVEDAREVVEFAKNRFLHNRPNRETTATNSGAPPPPPPMAIVGVSLGGLFALKVTTTYPPKHFVAIALVAPAINVKWTFQKRLWASVGELLAKATPDASIVPAMPVELLTDDEKTSEEYKNDSLNYVGKLRAKFGNEILKAMSSLAEDDYRRLDGVCDNIFAIHAEDDQATCCYSTERVFMHHLKGIENKKFVKLTHTRGHLLLHEPGCEWTISLVVRFVVDAAVSAAASSTFTNFKKRETDSRRRSREDFDDDEGSRNNGSAYTSERRQRQRRRRLANSRL